VSKKIVVQKFGGAALATIEKIQQVAEIVIYYYQTKKMLPCVVVSAMGDTTDELIKLARSFSPNPHKRELDALLACGESMSASLLAISLQELGFPAISFSGRQAGIKLTSEYGSGKLIQVDATLLKESLKREMIPIVAGFQGYNEQGDVVTLGRGGSDLTAVILGKAVDCYNVEFYKNVNGIFDEDPFEHNTSIHYPYLNFAETLEIVRRSRHQVIYAPAIEYAAEHNLKLRVISFESYQDDLDGTYISNAG
jgi:aspartate kinase